LDTGFTQTAPFDILFVGGAGSGEGATRHFVALDGGYAARNWNLNLNSGVCKQLFGFVRRTD
jgi:hypothetical protein